MASQWFCDLMGKVEGPLTAAQLLQKVKRGEITELTPIRKDNSKWFPAAEVSGLFEAAFKDRAAKRNYADTEYAGDCDF